MNRQAARWAWEFSSAMKVAIEILAITSSLIPAPTTKTFLPPPSSADRMLFGTEAPGTGTGVINPETNKPSDDLIPLIDSIGFLNGEDKIKIFAGTAKRIFPLLKVN